jgi:inositol transport system substrate-binding protein
MKKTLRIMCVAILGLAVMGSFATAAPKAKFTVAFANVNDIYPYCVKLRNYLVSFAKAEGMNVLVTDAKGDVNQQNSQVETFIVQGANLISAISGDLDGSVPAVEECKKANIPYVSVCTSVNTKGYIYVGSENKQAGEVQGDYLAKVLPKNAKVLYLTGATNDQQYIDRKAGLVEKLFNVRKDVKLLAEQSSNNQTDKGMSITEDWLQAYPAFDCIVAQNDDSALGAVEALKTAKRLKGVIVVGIDGSDNAIASIKAGEMSMTVFQDAKGQAKAVIDIAKKIRDGAKPESIANVYIPFKAITKANLSELQ